MATTTTNFGWDIPQSTDLVKDGATAIAALGQDIDTALVDLKGGTTGQILSKASNTDLDYTWITNDQGDITGVTAGTGITGGGTSGAVTISFDQANFGGGQYAAGKNKILNGDFRINQRNFTSNTATNSYNFDRFSQVNGGTGATLTVTPQTFTPGAAPVAGYEGTNFVRCVTTNGSDSSTFAIYSQRVEDVRTFAGQTVTFSFWAKAGSGTPKVSFEIEQNFGSGGSSAVNLAASSATTISTSWVRYTATVNVPSISGKTIGTSSYLGVFIWVSAGSSFNGRANSIGLQTGTFDFWGLQLESGSTATPFQTATGTYQGELAACQRYYWKISNLAQYDMLSNLGTAISTGNSFVNFPIKSAMRVKPTAIEYANVGLTPDDIGNAVTISSLSLYHATAENPHVLVGNATATQFRPYYVFGNSATVGASYVAFTAEL